MPRSSTQPRPCKDPDCRGPHSPAERVALANELCTIRGVKLTKLRRQILNLLWESGRPTGAYEMIEALRLRESRPVSPPTVYRALTFLISQGLASKIESRNAFVPRMHPERVRECLFFICSYCGSTLELEGEHVAGLISEDAALVGFLPTRRVLEVEGTCARCSAEGRA